MTRPTPFLRLRRLPLLALALAGALLAAVSALADPTAHTVRPGWGEWWLPYNYAKHGTAIDSMFVFIFWLTMIIFIVVEVVLVVFLIKYRHRPGKVKGTFIHGNTRLEMAWTLAPAVILAILALASKGIWDRYRYAEDYDKSPQTEVLVIGEQFQWNVVYPGKDGKFGQYLAFPQPSDPPYRKLNPKAAMDQINKVAMVANPLGQNQNWDDPEAKPGQDDDYNRNPGRPIILPVNRPIAVRLSSKDVIHDFFLPNFRVKLDALPGMYGRVNFTAMPEAQSTEDVSIDDPRITEGAKQAAAANDPTKAFAIWIDSKTPGAIIVPSEEVSQVTYALNGIGPDGNKISLENRTSLTFDAIGALKKAGVNKVTAITRPFELVCEELCGQGHSTMRGVVIFVSGKQYDAFIEKKPPTDATTKEPGIARATTRPSVAVVK